jgi:four helix bundle protein
MARSFEETEAWLQSRALVDVVYKATKKKEFNRDLVLVGQIRKAAISVMSYMAEGFERGTNKEFIQSLYIAKGSCGEVQSQLYVSLDQEYLLQEEFDHALGQCRIVSSQLGRLIQYLKRSSLKGEKHKRS